MRTTTSDWGTLRGTAWVGRGIRTRQLRADAAAAHLMSCDTEAGIRLLILRVRASGTGSTERSGVEERAGATHPGVFPYGNAFSSHDEELHNISDLLLTLIAKHSIPENSSLRDEVAPKVITINDNDSRLKPPPATSSQSPQL